MLIPLCDFGKLEKMPTTDTLATTTARAIVGAVGRFTVEKLVTVAFRITCDPSNLRACVVEIGRMFESGELLFSWRDFGWGATVGCAISFAASGAIARFFLIAKRSKRWSACSAQSRPSDLLALPDDRQHLEHPVRATLELAEFWIGFAAQHQ